MHEISIILKDSVLVTVEEFRILDQFSHPGRLWKLIQKPTIQKPFFVVVKKVEYIFDPESLTLFTIVSRNILVTWETDKTKNIEPDEEFHLKDTLFLKPHTGRCY